MIFDQGVARGRRPMYAHSGSGRGRVDAMCIMNVCHTSFDGAGEEP